MGVSCLICSQRRKWERRCTGPIYPFDSAYRPQGRLDAWGSHHNVQKCIHLGVMTPYSLNRSGNGGHVGWSVRAPVPDRARRPPARSWPSRSSTDLPAVSNCPGPPMNVGAPRPRRRCPTRTAVRRQERHQCLCHCPVPVPRPVDPVIDRHRDQSVQRRRTPCREKSCSDNPAQH